MGKNYKVTFDKAAAVARIKAAADFAVYTTAAQALKDSNQYCPEDQHTLLESSITNSELEKGILRWKAPYARYQYYGMAMEGRAPKSVTDRPLHYTKAKAHKMWAHYAKSKHGKEWQKVFRAALNKGG